MMRLQILTWSFLTIALTQTTFGQVKKAQRELKQYLKQLKVIKVDTVLVIKSGCTGCDVTYKDTPRSVLDGESIYVLTSHNGQTKIALFDDIHLKRFATFDTCSLFEFINQNKITLGQKEMFYKTETPKIRSKSGFYPPSPIHYSYDELNIKLSSFNYNFMILNDTKDHFGLERNKEKWFTLTKEIIKRVYGYSQLIND